MKRTEENWEKRWSHPDFSLHWTAEMFAYMFSAARLGIRHMITDLLQNQPHHHKLRVAPVIHYRFGRYLLQVRGLTSLQLDVQVVKRRHVGEIDA